MAKFCGLLDSVRRTCDELATKQTAATGGHAHTHTQSHNKHTPKHTEQAGTYRETCMGNA